ncbi:ABC transporter permease [Rhodovibrionaceae bacterium A322]
MASVADTLTTPEALTTADGQPLKQALARAERHRRLRAIGLVAPLFIFLSITFLYPIGLMLWRSIDNPVIADNLPNTVVALQEWDGTGLPDEAAYAALAMDLAHAKKEKTVGRVATRLNFETSGLRSVITRTARKAAKMKAGPYKEQIIKANKIWGTTKPWSTIKRLGNRLTHTQYLAAVDLRTNEAGEIVSQPEDRQIYISLFERTLWMSVVVTIACLLLGYPIAYLLSTLPVRLSNLFMIMVLLPFWTSLLVRTTSWIVLLQTQGVVNDILVFLGIVDDAGRIQLIFNAEGTVIAMTQILLPFMVLPLYSVMKTISPNYMRAAQSLGAHRFIAFWRVYAPNTLPGVGAGCLLVFILAIGYYITPALVGGEDGQMISNLIAFHMQKSLNWGLAAALGGILLAGVLALYWLYSKLVGIENLKLG